MRVYNADDGALLLLLNHTSWVNCVVWSPDGSLLASAGDDYRVRLWDVASGTMLSILEGQPVAAGTTAPPIWRIAFSPNGGRMAGSVHYPPAGMAQIQTWDTASGQVVGAYRPSSSGRSSYTLSDVVWLSSNRMALDFSGGVSILDLDSGEEAARSGDGRVFDFAWTPDGRRLATGMAGGQIVVWDSASGLPLRDIPFAPTLPNRIENIAWSEDGSRIAAANYDGMIGVWDAASGALVQSWDNAPDDQPHGFYSLLWAGRDGARLITQQDSLGITLWDVGSATPLHTFEPYFQSPYWLDSRGLLFGVGPWQISLMNFETGEITEFP